MTDRVKRKVKHTKKKSKIVDVPLAKSKSLGTQASTHGMDFLYAGGQNRVEFFFHLSAQKKIKNIGFMLIPGWSVASIKKILGQISTLELVYAGKGKKNVKVKVWLQRLLSSDYKLSGEEVYKKILINIKERFIPISLGAFGHGNMVLVDNKLKQVEMFEPHGYKKDYSTPSDHVSHYHAKEKVLKAFFKKMLPKYKFINASNILKRPAFQRLYDSGRGFCATWCAIYFHYRILNPDKKLKDILERIDEFIDTDKLLRYAKYMENILKGKKNTFK